MGTSDATLKIRVDPESLERWKAAAEAKGQSLSAFVRESVNHASTRPVGRMPSLDEPAARAVAPVAPVSARREHLPVRPVAAKSSRDCRTPSGAFCKQCGSVHP